MNQEKYLAVHFQGDGYDREVTISYNNDKSVILFEQLIYKLISSYDNEIQMNLNFGSEKFLAHAIKRLGDLYILIPRFYSSNSDRYLGREMYLTIEDYLTLANRKIVFFTQIDFIHLWENLGYNLYDLDEIEKPSQNDLTQLWLISSGYQPPESLNSFWDRYAQKLLSSIITVDSPNGPPVKYIIDKIIKHQYIFDISTTLKITNLSYYTIYFEGEQGKICEWQPLAALNSDIYIILDQLFVKIMIS